MSDVVKCVDKEPLRKRGSKRRRVEVEEENNGFCDSILNVFDAVTKDTEQDCDMGDA